MHAPNKDTNAITRADTPADVAKTHPDTPCTEMHQNAPFCTTFEPIALPTLPPVPAAPPSRINPNPATPLTAKQRSAISLLCTGTSLTAAAAKLKIDRSTLFRWRHTHPAFIAELARRQHDLHDTAARRLRLSLLTALATVTDEIKTAEYHEDRVKTALALLRHVDLPALLSAHEPLTPDLALDHLIRQDWSSRNLDPQRQVDEYDRHQYLLRLTAEESQAPNDTHPTHRRLAGTPLTPPEPYPTPSNALPTPNPTKPPISH